MSFEQGPVIDPEQARALAEHFVGCGSSGHDNLSRWALARDEEATKYETMPIVGVGDGSGQMFVRGEYVAVKQVQKIILENDRLHRALKRIAGFGCSDLQSTQCGLCQSCIAKKALEYNA